MAHSSDEKEEKTRALKKLISTWLSVKGTEHKANLLLAKNPKVKKAIMTKKRKAP
jgi:hypothetical protein